MSVMAGERRFFFIVLAVLFIIAGTVLLLPRVSEELAPRPVAAWVAIEPEGSGMATVGPVELDAGTPFTLQAVLEARRRDGSELYYTQAPALTIGGRKVPADAIEPWDRPGRMKILWFTVEGAVPFLDLKPGQGLGRFHLGTFFRADWPQTWSIPGHVDPANDDDLVLSGLPGPFPFGTQRYAVRIERYDQERDLIPAERWTSWGSAELRQHLGEFPTVVASLPGVIGPASAVFGLTEIDPPPGEVESLAPGIAELARQRLAFSRLTVLDAVLRGAGRTLEDLHWRLVDLKSGPAWGSGPDQAAAGDLLRVGDRVVVLYRDEAPQAALGQEDLCFDYAEGALVRPLHDVFAAGGDVEWAKLAP